MLVFPTLHLTAKINAPDVAQREDIMNDELTDAIEAIGNRFTAFKAENAALVKRTVGEAMAEEVLWRTEIERKLNLARLGPDARPSEPPAAMWRDAKTGQLVPALTREQKLADRVEQRADMPSLGRLLRGLACGSAADDAKALAEQRKALSIDWDSGGGILVPEQLSARFQDALRAKSVLGQAGVTTIPMGSKELTIARLASDPTVHWRGENDTVVPSDPTFGAATLHAKTVACLVRISLELSQDAANLEAILETTLVNAMAAAIDSAGLVGTTVDAAAAPTGIFNASGRSTVLTIGAPSNYDFVLDGISKLLLANVPLENVGAVIGHPSLWLKLAKLKSGIASDQTTLVPPPDVAKLPRLWSTAAPLTGNTAKAVIGDWRDYLFGIRRDVNVRVLREAFLGSNLQIGILCYARVDFVPARPQSFCTLEGITV